MPKSGHVTITKIENLHIDTHRKKYTDSKNAILFDRCRTVVSPGAGGVFRPATVLERSIEVRFSLILSIYKVVYISIKDVHAGYAATCWRNLLSNLPKTKLHYAIKDS